MHAQNRQQPNPTLTTISLTAGPVLVLPQVRPPVFRVANDAPRALPDLRCPPDDFRLPGRSAAEGAGGGASGRRTGPERPPPSTHEPHRRDSKRVAAGAAEAPQVAEEALAEREVELSRALNLISVF